MADAAPLVCFGDWLQPKYMSEVRKVTERTVVPFVKFSFLFLILSLLFLPIVYYLCVFPGNSFHFLLLCVS